jgi:alcohol dehydrogenase class IV
LNARGFEGFALLTTVRAVRSAPAVADAAAAVLHVPPGPVPEAAAAVRDEVGGRALVALGGGRVVDSAKAIAGAGGLSCAAIPTTLSGAEMTPFHRMPAGVDEFRFVRPSLVIAEPGLMASQPEPQLSASAMNALAHAIEALYTPLANPVGDMAALRATRLIADGEQLGLGALLAGYASGIAGFAVHHAVCQTIVRTAGTPHAETNAVMLPHFVRMMEGRAPDAIERVAAALEGRDVSELAARAGVTRLSALGVDASALEEIVETALRHPALGNTRGGPPRAEELRAVLGGAL